MSPIKGTKVLMLDAANTIIHKPVLWQKFQAALEQFGYFFTEKELKFNHKLVSECYQFPDQTSKDFYQKFNQEFLRSLGVLPNEQLLNLIFETCSYLPWEKFEDCEILNQLELPIVILSNFSVKLTDLLEKQFPSLFKNFFISEDLGVSKPDPNFFMHAIAKMNVNPDEILYVGDSIKLDLEPALNLGINSLLIDRELIYEKNKYRISSLFELNNYL